MDSPPRSRRGRLAACAALLALAAAGAAARAAADPPGPAHWLYDGAATTPLEQGQFYAGFTLHGGVQQLPRFSGTQSFYDLTALPLGAPSFTPDIAGVQPGGEIGYVFRDGIFPRWMGSRVRAAVYGSYLHAEASDSRSIRPPQVAYALVSGTFLGVAFLPPGTTFAETLKVEREAFQLGLKLESDIALGANLSLTPAVAVFGGRTHDSYTHTSVLANFFPGFDAGPTQLNERLRTREFGGHVGARLTWQVLPGWALHLGGTAGPVWLRTRMTAEDCLSDAGVPPGTPCGPSNGTLLSSSAADTRSTVGFRGTASLGLAVDLRYALVSLGGFMRYDSRIPGVENPQRTGPFTFAPLPPARIRFADGFAYGGFLTLRVTLY